MVEHLIALVERNSYLEFLRSDLRDLFARSGISIAEERSALLGSARIVVGAVHLDHCTVIWSVRSRGAGLIAGQPSRQRTVPICHSLLRVPS